MQESKEFFQRKLLPESKFDRGYKYFWDGYICDIWTNYNDEKGYFRML